MEHPLCPLVERSRRRAWSCHETGTGEAGGQVSSENVCVRANVPVSS